jgi:hypothetical protein
MKDSPDKHLATGQASEGSSPDEKPTFKAFNMDFDADNLFFEENRVLRNEYNQQTPLQQR